MTSQNSTSRFECISLPTEDIEEYHPGGFQPVHFNDTFNGTYRILGKLGFGSFSTVWVAEDTIDNRFVALKILTAKHSSQTPEVDILRHLNNTNKNHPGYTHVTPLLDSFEHCGPNGNHLCLVLEVMGPSAVTMEERFKKPGEPWVHVYPNAISKNISRQTLLGLDFLHSNGIIHGDIQAGNILFTIPEITSANQLPGIEGRDDIIAEVKRLDGMELDESTPRYIVAPGPLSDNATTEPGFQIKISDLGGAFWKSNPPKLLITPIALRAPELIVPGALDASIDVWSLGCVIFQLVTGNPLFTLETYKMSDEDINDEHLLQLIEIIGPLPESILQAWGRSTNYFNENGGYITERVEPMSLEEMLKYYKPQDMDDDEMEILVSLLRSMLRYEPGERAKPSALSGHLWFSK